MVSRLGHHVPMHCIAVGKVIWANMDEDFIDDFLNANGLPRRIQNTMTDAIHLKKQIKIIKEQGFAIDDEENETDIRCVGAPIRNEIGKVGAAISVPGPATRVTIELINNTLKRMVGYSAMKISRKLGYAN